MEAELSKKCDELRQLFLLQQQSNNNNNNDVDEVAASPTSSSPTSATSTAFLRSLRKTKVEADEDSDSSSLIANNSGEASEESSINFSFSKEIASLKQTLKTQVISSIGNSSK